MDVQRVSMENKAAYIAGEDPSSELRKLLSDEDIMQIVRGIRQIQANGGWGEIRMPFVSGKMTKGTVTTSTACGS